MNPKICVDRILPEEQVIQAAELATDENPANAVEGRDGLGTYELALDTKRNWSTGRVLKVQFMEGNAELRTRVSEVARQWCNYANLIFDFDDHLESDIRISFAEGSSWSWIGTDALAVEHKHPTMNFGWLKPDSPEDDFHRVVLHEFGHAIGCIHEHQSPEGGIPWNVPKVYDYYMTSLNWTKQQIDENLFDKYDRDSTQYGEFDPSSIMIYYIPKELTLNGFEVKWNTALSDTDKKMIGEVYP